jgi:hypothetical protein
MSSQTMGPIIGVGVALVVSAHRILASAADSQVEISA